MIVKKLLFTAQQGKELELKEMLTSLVAPSQAEEGCLRYDLFANDDMPNEFMIIAIWKSQEDLDIHETQPHFLKFKEMKNDLVASEESAPISSDGV